MKKLAILILVLIIAASAFYYWTNRTVEWKTYRNPELGISLKYPENYKLSDYENSGIALCDKCATPGEDIEIVFHSNEKNIPVKELAQKGVILNANNTGVEQTELNKQEAWILKSNDPKGLQFETIFTTLKNNKVLEFGVGFKDKNEAIYQDFQKMIPTIEFF